jgi:uncharacterized protein (DUF1778 family)
MNRAQYDAEIERLDALADSDDEFAGATRVEGSVAKERRTLFSLRIGADELSEVSRAAAARGQNVSEFIRGAALQVARQGTMDLPPPVLEAVDELVRRYRQAQESTKRRGSAIKKSA